MTPPYRIGQITRAPLLGLVQAWQLKLPLSVVGAWALDALIRASAMWSMLFDGDEILMAGCLTLLLLDTATGITAAVRRGERVRSRVFRQAGWKLIEYTALGVCAVVITNAFHHTLFRFITDNVDEATLFYVAATEAFSVAENVLGSRARADAVLKRILRVLSFLLGRAVGRVEAAAGVPDAAAEAAADVDALATVITEISGAAPELVAPGLVAPAPPTAGEEPAALDALGPTR